MHNLPFQNMSDKLVIFSKIVIKNFAHKLFPYWYLKAKV